MASDNTTLQDILRSRWSKPPGEKARRYVGKFYGLEKIGDRITGKVEGNHGAYTVSIWVTDNLLVSTCGCYIGKHGYCHHCEALAHTYLQNPGAFVVVTAKERGALGLLNEVYDYLKTTTLEKLLAELKAKGISQKVFAESIGMSTRHLTAVKSGEQRNHFYHELGAIKLACLWVLEHIAKKE